jgi:hypothetical protein
MVISLPPFSGYPLGVSISSILSAQIHLSKQKYLKNVLIDNGQFDSDVFRGQNK